MFFYYYYLFLKSSSNTNRTIDVRLRAFDNILQLLNVATQLGIGPKLNELAAKQSDDLLLKPTDEQILSSPIQPLGALRKVKSKSVAVQTSISNRVRLNSRCLINRKLHFFFAF